jgi:AAA ATPase domain
LEAQGFVLHFALEFPFLPACYLLSVTKMDIALSIQLAGNIAKFIDSTNKVISTVSSFDESHNGEINRPESINKLTKGLLGCTAEIQFKVPDGVTMLTEEDSVLRQLCQDCQGLASDILTDLERFQPQNETEDWEYIHRPALAKNANKSFQQRVDAIRYDLNERLSPLLWLSLNHLVRELAGKNSRFDANRTKDIVDLGSDIDIAFRKINTEELDEDEKLSYWAGMPESVQTAMEYTAEQVILGDMQFWTMNRREDSISKEHEHTFEWIFSQKPSNNSVQPHVNFADWLIRQEPLYWISGKPGSGKSTLMKYIAKNPRTMDYLKHWAGDNKLVTASFYFWSSARDPLQKSGSGLLRSILFQILRQCPEMIQHAFPDQWREAQFRGPLERVSLTDSSADELLDAYQRIADSISTKKVKFCFFIDGLDEYEGNSPDIIRLIQLLSRSRNLKTCISSRPWNDFESSFGGSNPWKLYVHELTRNDMKIYVESLLHTNRPFRKIKEATGDKDVQDLVSSIVENAEGVFLWVFLVVRSLLEGLKGTEHLTDLHHKLVAIPNDLDKYFEKMLLDIPEAVRKQTARNFLITLLAVEKLPLLSYWFIEEETLDDVMSMRQQVLTRETAATRLQQMSERLKTNCKGFLTASNIEQSLSKKLEEHQWLFQFRVDFLHRTVADFLRTADMQQLLKKWSAESFDADLEICKACIATVNVTSPKPDHYREPSRILSTLHLFFSHIKLLQGPTAEEVRIALIDEISVALKVYSQDVDGLNMMILGPGNYWSYEASFNFVILYHCASYGLGTYLGFQLDRKQLQFSEPSSGLLSGCLAWDPRIRPGRLTLDLDSIRVLLQRGLDPNLPWGDRKFSFWQMLLTTTYSSYLKGFLTQAECNVIKLATDHGSNLNVSVDVFGSRRGSEITAATILEKILPREQYLALQGSETVSKMTK